MPLLMIAFIVFGVLTNLMGAFGAHALKAHLSPEILTTYHTAVQYHFYHTLTLGLTLLFDLISPNKWFYRAGLGFCLGMILFCGSLYVLAISGIKSLGLITPLGGVIFILSWFMFGAGLNATYSQIEHRHHK